MIEKRLRHTRIYEQVVNELKELIASGELLPGDPLPRSGSSCRRWV